MFFRAEVVHDADALLASTSAVLSKYRGTCMCVTFESDCAQLLLQLPLSDSSPPVLICNYTRGNTRDPPECSVSSASALFYMVRTLPSACHPIPTAAYHRIHQPADT
jgi:hypothetical protein